MEDNKENRTPPERKVTPEKDGENSRKRRYDEEQEQRDIERAKQESLKEQVSTNFVVSKFV